MRNFWTASNLEQFFFTNSQQTKLLEYRIKYKQTEDKNALDGKSKETFGIASGWKYEKEPKHGGRIEQKIYGNEP